MKTIPNKLGRYQIIRELGRGAMGVVYKAHDPVIEREVAVKAIHLAFEVSREEKNIYLNRFFREAKAAGKLNHPNIVTIYDVDEDKETGIPFIVMEFLEGTTLQEIITGGILLPLEDVNNIMIQVADALHYAHENSVIHRDVKSANILVLHGMKVKIMDFGIARLPSSDLTQSGQFIGTPNYMSPEQIEGKGNLDGRSDLFSMGVIFYLLLTGERPFSGDSFTSVSYKIVHVDPIPPRNLNPAIPEGYNKILTKLLAKDPNDRYNSGEELIADLRKLDSTGNFVEESRQINDVTAIAVPLQIESPAAPITVDPETISGRVPPKSRMAFLQKPNFLRNAIITALAAFLMLAVFLLFHASRKEAPAANSSLLTEHTLLQRERALRTKWDLARNYYENGFYDKSISELDAILLIDPAHNEAKQFLEIVREKKQKTKDDEQNKVKQEAEEDLAEQTVKLSRPKNLQPKSQSGDSVMTAPVAPPLIGTSKKAVTPLLKPAEIHPVNVEFEHQLPSGIFSIYKEGRLIYRENITGEKQRVLLFQIYKGKLSTSVELPPGQSKLGIRLVSRELGISTYKETVIQIGKESPRTLKIRYHRGTKQLEVKWI